MKSPKRYDLGKSLLPHSAPDSPDVAASEVAECGSQLVEMPRFIWMGASDPLAGAARDLLHHIATSR
ncbi:MAG: hypothetical protein JO045_28890 [Mycobacterium sp.]|nr:hypothetical protein [Mycobacterium sp.]